MNSRRTDRYDDNCDDYDYEPKNLPPEKGGKKLGGKSMFDWAKIALVTAILLVGIGIGDRSILI